MGTKIENIYIGPILVGLFFGVRAIADYQEVWLHRQIDIPGEFLTRDGTSAFGGDIRIGDVSGDGICDFVVYRSAQGGESRQHQGGIKPCFIAAFDIDGKALWQHGKEGEQPVRPGPVAVYDFDGDGSAEIVCLWHRPDSESPSNWLSLSDVVIQIRDGESGYALRERAIPEIASLKTGSPKLYTWPHQRILIANFRGLDRPRDLLLKVGATYVAITDKLEVLWTYRYRLENEERFPPKFPAIGDMDGDGRDEVHGGYFLLSHEGEVHWTLEMSKYMDSVTIDVWDSPYIRAISSGTPQVMGFSSEPILALGDGTVPHGQELRVANFIASSPGMELAIRNQGHNTRILVVSRQGSILRDFDLNEVPNDTGMESVYLRGREKPALLFNGNRLWDLEKQTAAELPGLPKANGKAVHRMGFYHAIPADLTGDGNEDLVVYEPTSTRVFVYAMDDPANSAVHIERFISGPRQYNPRLMD